jgi:mitogen-activated protein kinase 1/3
VALDLLGKMLHFSPLKRYNIKQCLAHPYFEGLHNESTEPVCKEPFDWSWDNFEPTKEILQDMVYEESLKYHPDKVEKPSTSSSIPSKKRPVEDLKSKISNL